MVFPSNNQFQPILLGAQPIFDVVGDESPSSTDIVGNSQFPAAYFAYDGQNIYFRIRLNTTPINAQLTGFRNFTWGVLINTSGTPGVYDWLANINGLNNTINLVQNTQRQFNSWNDPAEGTNGQGAPNYSRPIVNFDTARAVLTSDGSNFGGNPDYFIDFQFPANVFFQTLGINESTQLRTVIFTSANANNYNKDSLRTSEGFQFVNALTNPSAPEDVDVRADLAVSKSIASGPQSILNGAEGTWNQTVTVTNTGLSLARQLFINDVIQVDQLTSLHNVSASLGSTAFNQSTNTLSWNIGNLNPGETVNLSHTVSGTFTSSGTRTLNTVTSSGIDNFTGGLLPVRTDSNSINVIQAAAITGQVTSGLNGLPLTGVTVELRDAGNVLIASTTTNGNGNYNFTNVTPSTYNLTYSLSNYMLTTRTTAVAAGQTEIVNVILPPDPGTLTGSVQTTGAMPISGAIVRVIDSFNTVLGEETTNAQGMYTFPNLSPGFYTLTVSASTFQSQTRAVTIHSNTLTNENFILQDSPGTVTGTVQNETNTPIPNASVQILDAGNNVIASAVTDVGGNYTIDQLAPGTYSLRTRADGYQTSLLGFSVMANQTTVQNVTLLAQPGTLSGEVTDSETGDSIEGASVQVISQSGITVAVAQTNAGGNYTIPSLPAGSYTVTFSQAGYASIVSGIIIPPNGVIVLNAQMNQITGRISGTVQSTGGQAIEGAIVHLLQNGISIASSFSDEMGQYTFANLTPGNYTVRAAANNFETEALGAQVNAFETTTINFSLAQNPGTLTGTVVDTGNNPIPGTIVTVRESVSGAVAGTGITDQNGEYILTQLAPGIYAVTAAADNIQSATLGTVIEPNAISNLNFTLMANPVSINGTVINQQTGDPIEGAQIEVRVLDVNGTVIRNVLTNNFGEFLVDQLAPGTYTVVASALSFQTNFATVTVPPGGQETVQIALTPNPGLLTGSITAAASGSPIAGAVVQVVTSENVLIETVLTDQNGQYTAGGLPPGNYNVVVTAANFQTKVGGAIILAGTTSTVDLMLIANPGAINGTVTPVQPNNIVQLYNTNNVFITSVIADQNGFYSFMNLAPGSYIVTGSAPNFSTVSTGTFVNSDETTTVDINLTANPASIAGTIFDENANPISNATIRVFDSNEVSLGTAGTDAEGNYSIGNLPPGALTVVVTAPGFSQVISGVILQPGESQADVDFTLAANSGAISGLVIDAITDDLLANVSVVIRQAGSSDQIVASATTSPFGNYTVSGLSPGSYTVTASLPGYGTITVGAIVVSDTTTNANISLIQLAGSIEGQLIDADGDPITGANLQLKLLNDLNVTIITILANPDGSFVFSNIEPGTYVIQASAPGFQSKNVGVLVQADAITQSVIQLDSSPAVLTGQVISQQSGTGIIGSTVTVSDPLTGSILGSGFTNQAGEFRIENLPAGSYNVTASASNFGSASTAVVLTAGDESTVILSLASNPGQVTGTVIDRITGFILAGASVQVFDQTGAFVFSTNTDAQGNYIATGLSPATYTVLSSFNGYANQLISLTVTADETSIASFALDPNPSTLTGQVTDDNGSPIAGAQIIVRQFTAAGPIIATALSHDDGFYLIPGLPQGSFTIIATAPNYGTQASSVLLEPGETIIRDFILTQLVSSVTGTVTDAGTGEPLINVLIQLLDTNGILIGSFQTDPNGTYLIEDFTPGSYILTFTQHDYQSQSLSFSTMPEETATVNARLAADPGTLSGVVLDNESNPLIGASVRVFPALGILPIATLVTDGTGSFNLSGAAPGAYVLTVSYENYSTGQTGITVISNQTTSSTIILFPDPATITGQIRSSTGVPITNATVRVVDQNETVLATVVTDEFGNYAITNLPPGNHQIIISAPGFGAVVGGVILGPGDIINNLDFELTANPGRIQGQVTDTLTGEPVTGAITVVRTVGGIPVVVASSFTDENGNYLIEGLAPGSYSVTSTATGYGTTVVGAIIESDQTTTVNIGLSPIVGSISGLVTNQNGDPLTNTAVEIKVFDQAGNLIIIVLADSNGQFTIPELNPGSYQLTISAQGFSSQTVGAVVEAGEDTFLTIPLASNPARITGQVVDSVTSDPISGAIVTVSDVNGLPITNAVTDLNGNFLIGGLPPTTVIVSAVAAGYGSASTAVLLSPGATVSTTIALTPQPGGVTGVVTSAVTSEPISGATVQIFDETRALVVTLTTDPNGLYSFTNLSGGVYRIVVSAAGFGTALQDVTVSSNQITTATFSLVENPGSIRGTVINQVTGEPLLGVTVVIRQFSPTGPIIQTIATDSNGQFLVENLTPGAYTVTAFTPSFGSQSASVQVNANLTTEVTLELLPNAGTVEGMVTSSVTGAGLSNVRVSVFDDNGILVVTVQTDNQGRYQVEGLRPGSYTITFFHPDFQTATIGTVIIANQTSTVNAALQPNPGRIEGQVFDAFEEVPLIGAVVQLFPSQSLIPIANAVTDDNGFYYLPGVAPGEYIITASFAGYARAAVGATAAAGQTTTANLFLIPDPASINGTVTSSEGGPIQGASVRIVSQDEVVLGTALTAADGSYFIGNLPQGSHTVVFSAQGFGTEYRGITLTVGEEEVVNAVLYPNPGAIAGLVYDTQTSQPIIGADVVVRRIIGGSSIVVANATSDQDGKYFIPGLSPGVFTVSGSANGYAVNTIVVVVAPDEIQESNIPLTSLTGRLEGRVRDTEGDPITDQQVSVRIFDEENRLIITLLANNQGEFSVLNLAPGNYTTAVSTQGYESTIVPFSIEAGLTTSITVILGVQPATLFVNVRDRVTGEPIAGAGVSVLLPDGRQVGDGVTDSDGVVVLTGLPPGELRVVAAAVNYFSENAAIILAPNEVLELTITLQPISLGRIIGQIVDQDTTFPISNALVELINENGEIINQTATDSEGLFRFEDVPEGPYRLRISALGYETLTASIQVFNGETTFVRIELLQEGNPCLLENREVTCTIENMSCQEVNSEDRESFIVQINGEDTVLQLVKLALSFTILLEVEGENGACTSDPIQQTVYTQALLCAPDGSRITCTINDIFCCADLQCRVGNVSSVLPQLSLNLTIQSLHNTTVSIEAFLDSQPHENLCINVDRVLDWVSTCLTKEIHLENDLLTFTCDIN
ncbi:carboxypeptidase regulatory-like domain-containing protein [Halobacillus sp. B23F22_1]|uniref:carboxypeptidase regulatory-like domain-containing protein n=1 Tax=Halobacillus sp. B23F22_1 TaxID=3459514 RepID=UPI00373E1FCD